MLSQSDIEKIQKEIYIFFQKMTFDIVVELLPPEENTASINLKSDDPQILIGEGGQTLFDIQRLLTLILRKEIGQIFFLDLDINSYKKKKNEYLKELARSTADEVSLAKKEKALGPMSAYERRVIHMELAGRNDVTTGSTGEEPERRVVIKPRF
jgi:spoIIIJ-associated protein